MTALAGPVGVVALTLGVAAAAKLFEPTMTVGALRAAGVPANAAAVRVGALGELGLALGAFASGAPPALAGVALSYAGFALFVGIALRHDRPIATCGCIGRADTPPGAVHVVLDALAAVVAAVAAVGGDASPVRALAQGPVSEAIAFAAMMLIATALFLLSITSLPRLLALRAPTRS